MATPICLSALHCYPVKSLRGVTLDRSCLDRFGLVHDRRWMVVDGDGGFLSQRELPRMALVGVEVVSDGLLLNAPDMPDLRINRPTIAAARIEVEVWQDRLEGSVVGQQADAWLSRFLGVECRLVYMMDDVKRQVDQRYAEPRHQTAFSDGFPLLLTSEASLEELNGRLESPLSMIRFRPNLVVSGSQPYAEDRWARIRIGTMELRLVKPCSRCSITTVDPDSGARGVEPLATLAAYRRRGKKVFFGQNLIYDRAAELRVGMSVEVLEYRDEE
ncbi:MAG: MOSC domain-containing protein [Candidatus Thiodiazotropha sp. (ex. Lucinisca nassula)]|nr:MOSC domain-containing protein [Candidatus Thiodiazotropha sp. (ex. Lucinisca nassula)]MBW9269619.1 MOSC domain-containing protein [Candidatus Thiodiazotropha sp. (ex. Lucinisca nassula)]